MAAINFGYTISKPRAIDMDRNNLRKSDEILREMPELQTCIGCGACEYVCPARPFSAIYVVGHEVHRTI